MTEPSSKEASLDTAREMLRSGAQIDDVVATSGLPRNTVLGLFSALVRARKRANARSERSEAEIEPEIEFEAENERDAEPFPIDGGGTAVLHPSVPSPSSLPGSIPLLEEDRASVRKLVPEKAHGPLQVIWDNAARRESQRFNNGHNNDGHGVPSYGSADDDLKRAKARFYDSMRETEELEGLEDVRQRRIDRRTNPKSSESDPQKAVSQILEAIKLGVDLVPKGANVGRDPVDYVLAGNQMRSDIEKNVQSQYSVGVAKSEIDLKLEEMQQQERLDYKKLEYDERRAEKKDAADNKKWEFAEKGIKALASEPVAGFLRTMGGAAKDAVHGSGGRIPTIDISCPNCGNRFKASPKLDTVICNSCGAQLQKQPSQPQAQAETPKAEPEPEAAPQPPTEMPEGREQPEPKAQPPEAQEPEKLSEKQPTEVIKT